MSDIQEYDADEQVTLNYTWIENLMVAKVKVEIALNKKLKEGVVSHPDTLSLIGDLSFLLGYINSIKWHLEVHNEKKNKK